MQFQSSPWQPMIQAATQRFNREYGGQPFDLPAEVEAMEVFRDWTAGTLTSRIASPFWQLAQPRKQQRCLDLGCGFSFLIYDWREWQALFYGQDVSPIAVETLRQRGPQLNSKLFKSVVQRPAHQLDYGDLRFDLAIATGFSCYYPLDYWQTVLDAVKRVLKPEGFLVFDVIDPEQPLAENWAILETYLGAEVFLTDLADWRALIRQAGAQVVKQQEGDPFHLYKIRFG
ncbi:class I SAM-dependent methyltransferase [Romeria aff. gracilis LEGE 07310]|uniref:Class I SAM-dependent methyltransferase n=1 Tax=Vasconcelosia minhoensis LEGE 07310 TaxID=915328 RepID=A0A8J7DRF2_9CYAN|nr:class I SAM-dependent methyltransferase [Romeria gracilis]MBE9078379.1 class I SAM-dependent methyltransferase [Romeria aff. gracilis LEGE 07310]